MDEWPSWGKGYDAHPSEKGFGKRRKQNMTLCWGWIAVIFGFTKMPGLTSKTSNVFC